MTRRHHHPRMPTLAVLFLVLLALPATALEVPFSNGTDIDSSTNRGFSTFPADIDGDGDLDVLSAVSTPGSTLSWWENNGSGSSFTEHPIASAVMPPVAMTGATSAFAADIDGDGDLDVLGAAYNDGDIIVFRNDNGVGTAWSATTVDLSATGVRHTIFADLDGDGDLDVVAAVRDSTPNVRWYENTAGDGSTWSGVKTILNSMNGARYVGVADIDADGDSDVVASAELADKISFLRNSSLTWSEVQINTDLLDGGSQLDIADFDGDGKLDVAAVAENASNVLWWRNTVGDGSVWVENYVSTTLNGAHGLAAADFDFDGDIDLVTGARAGAELDWWENSTGDGTTWDKHLIQSLTGPGRAVAVGDINKDGWIDVVLNSDTKLRWWKNEAIHRNTPFLQTRDVDLAALGAWDIKAADLDHDGDLDLVGSAKTGDKVVAYRNTSSDGTSFTTTNVATGFDGAGALDLGDIDRDGQIDIVGAADDGGDLVWWRNANGLGTSFTATNIDLGFLAAKAVKLADIDGDGDLDLAAASTGGDEIAFYRNTNGDGSLWNKITAISFFVDASGVDVGDIDGDGDLDIVGSATGDDAISWAKNTTGDGSAFTEQVVTNSFDGAAAVKLADIDHDGDLDIVAVAELADTAAWFENTAGNGTAWTQHTIDATLDGARGVEVADLDQDGDLDVIATQANGTGRVVAFLNVNGNGLTWSTLSIDNTFAGGALVSAADVDGDGRPDVLAGAATDGDLQWWRNGGGQVALPTTNTSPASLGNSVIDDVLRIDLRHNGKAGEQNAELATLELRFEDGSAIALDSAQANGLVENLSLYLDTGNAIWDGSDTLIQTDSALSLTSGVHTMTLPDGDANLTVAVGATKTYFLVAETTATYTSQPIGFFKIIHLTQSTSRVEDQPNDTPLRLEYQANTSSNLFQVNPSSEFADVQIVSISDAPDPVVAGEPVTYTVEVRNNGPSAAQNVSVTSTLPGGTTFSSTIGCNNDPSGNPSCTLGTLAATATVTFDIILDVASSTTGSLTYQASVTSTTTDTNPGNNSLSQGTTVNRSGDLSLQLIDQPPGTYADAFLHHYTIVISNAGPSDLSSSLVNDTFPAVLTGVLWSCTATAGSSCTASGSGNLVNSPVSLQAGGKATYRVRGTVPDGTTSTLANTATVTDPNDPNAGNNSATVMTIWGDPLFVDGFESGNTLNWQ